MITLLFLLIHQLRTIKYSIADLEYHLPPDVYKVSLTTLSVCLCELLLIVCLQYKEPAVNDLFNNVKVSVSNVMC